MGKMLDMSYIMEQLVKLCTTPSPTGDTEQIMDYLKSEFQSLGLSYRQTNKGGLIATLPGKDDERQRVLSGHVDTLGAMVSEVKSSGRLKFVSLGGYMMQAVEGEHVTITTACGKTYTGTVLTTKASSHVYGSDAHKLERVQANMEIRLDEKVSTATDTENLGINVGDFVSLDPRTEITPSGFIKSRHLDDKASVAVMLGVAKYYHENQLQPAATTHFFVIGSYPVVISRYPHTQVLLIVTHVVKPVPIPEPGQFKGKTGLTVAQINQDKRSVRSFFSSHFFQSQCLIIELNTFLKIKHIDIVMIKPAFNFHIVLNCLYCWDPEPIYRKPRACCKR